MEMESTNHQDVAEPDQMASGVAEPDQMASGVAGTGQKNAEETGITKHQTGENKREFSSLTGFDSILQGPENPDGFSCSLAIGQIAGTTKNPAAFTPEIYPASLKKSRKNTLVTGMEVLYNGEIKPVFNRNRTTEPADKDAEETVEDLIISFNEQQERIAEQVTKMIDQLDRRLTAIEKRRRSG